MATNEQIIVEISELRAALCKEIEKVDEKATKNDEALRGNGGTGLKAQVAENTKAIAKMEKYSQAVLMLVIGELLVRVFGHVLGL